MVDNFLEEFLFYFGCFEVEILWLLNFKILD